MELKEFIANHYTNVIGEMNKRSLIFQIIWNILQ